MPLTPDILTLVLPLNPGSEDATRDYIRAHTDLGWLPATDRWKIPRDDDPIEGPDTGIRHDALDFGVFPGLHCCAFVVLDAQTKPGFRCQGPVELPPYLIIEATIDGSGETFIRDLVDHCTPHLVNVLRHCEGLPNHAADQPDLLVDFLLRRQVRHSTYFSGVPGKTVSEIRSEAHLRTFLTKALQRVFFPTGTTGKAAERPKARFSDIQRMLRTLVRNEPSLNLADERSIQPWSVRHGKRVVALSLCLSVLIVALLIYTFASWLGWDFTHTLTVARALTLADFPMLTLWLGGFLLGWLVLRRLRIAVTPETRHRLHRGHHYLAATWLRFGLKLLRWAILTTGIVMILRYAGPENPVNALPFWLEIPLWILFLCAGAIALFRVKAWRAGPLRQLENGPFTSPAAFRHKAWLQARVDVADLVHLLWWLLVLAAVVAFFNPLIEWVWCGWVWDLCHLLTLALAAALYVALASAVLMALKDGLLTGAHLLQRCEDRNKFAPAEKLAEHNIQRERTWAREEHRTHLNQNHFASATLVKSLPRSLYLRLSLLLINFAARYWDNQGKLGGIPTIFSARWLLLDNGHRLVFLTNYVGAWDSYLGEFSDLNAYIGVNAIWTNTYLPLRDDQKERLGTNGRDVGFPTSRFMLFGGACLEQPFKAYVRQSQVETLAWYGAYPRLSVPNIHDNARIREELFQDLDPAALDALFRRI